MTEMIVTMTVALLGSGAVATVAVKFLERRKTTAETGHVEAQTTDVLVAASERAVELVRAELERAVQEIASMRVEMDEMQRVARLKDARIVELEREVIDLRSHIVRLES